MPVLEKQRGLSVKKLGKSQQCKQKERNNKKHKSIKLRTDKLYRKFKKPKEVTLARLIKLIKFQ